MRIVLVCINGLTTNILANRLQAYAKEHEKKDQFLTCRIYSYKESLDCADAFVLAPQTVGQNEELCRECENRGISYTVLDERTFVLNDLEKIYEWIDSNRKEDSETAGHHLTIPVFKEILFNSFMWLLFLSAFGMLFYGLSVLFGSHLLYHLYETTLGIIGLYLPIAMGYFYGQKTLHSPIVSSFKMLILLVIVMPALRYSGNWNVRFFSTSDVLYLEYFRIVYLPVICLLSILSVIAIEFGHRLFKSDKENLWSLTAILSNTFSILAGIVVRYFFLWIL